MHDAPRCQAITKAGEPCRKPAVRGRTRCETHGGNGAKSRNYAQQARDAKRAAGQLQWQINLQVRQLERTIRKLKRQGGPTDVIEDLAKRRWELLLLTGQSEAELAALLVPMGSKPLAEAGEVVAAEFSDRHIGPNHPMRNLNRDRAQGAMLGLAVGEAVGITLLGQPRRSVQPIENMWGGGRLELKAGQWADDTAMALALMDSLIHRGEFDHVAYLERLLDWRDRGDYSCTGAQLGSDAAMTAALARYESDRSVATCGPSFSNGSVVRTAPVAIRYWQQSEKRREVAIRQSLVTHCKPAVSMACAGFADILAEAIADVPKSKVLGRRIVDDDSSPRQLKIGDWQRLEIDDISGDDDASSSLEAALWCVGNSYTFRDAVVMAANLGGDAGSTAAIAGQLAGALYGRSGIPSDWLEQLAWRDRITEMTDALFDQGPTPARFS